MTDEYRKESSVRKSSITMLIVSTIVLVIVMAIAPIINKGTPPPKFFIIASVVYGIILAISIRAIAKGGRWLYLIADGRVRVEKPCETEASLDLAIEDVVGIHKRLGRKTQSYYLVDGSGERYKVPEHDKMHAGLLSALREIKPGLEETKESKRD